MSSAYVSIAYNTQQIEIFEETAPVNLDFLWQNKKQKNKTKKKKKKKKKKTNRKCIFLF